MFQLFKKRDFSALIGDTFSFFKLEGKNYFKNYFAINGGILLILILILYFFIKTFIDASILASQNQNSNLLADYILSNTTNFIAFGILLIIFISLASLINYSFPIFYLKLIEENKERNTENILSLLKKNIGKAIIFYLLSIVVIIPILFIIIGISILLVFLIIGIPLLFLIIPAATSWITLTYYLYMTTNDGYFSCLGKGFEMVKSKFWPIIGSTVVIYIIIQVIMGIFTMIPYFFGVVSIMTNAESIEQDPNSAFSTLSILMTIIFIVSIIMNYVLQNLLLVNQGIIFYSIKEADGNISIQNEIDSIGTHEE